MFTAFSSKNSEAGFKHNKLIIKYNRNNTLKIHLQNAIIFSIPLKYGVTSLYHTTNFLKI